MQILMVRKQEKLDDNDPGSLFNLAAEEIKRRGGVSTSTSQAQVANQPPEGLTTYETEAWNDAKARLKKDPGDANSLTIIELLSK